MGGVWGGTGALLAMAVDAVEFVSVGNVDIARVDVDIVGLAGIVDVCVGVVGAPNKEFKAFVNTAAGVVEDAVADATGAGAVGSITGVGAVEIATVEVVGVVRTGAGAVADAVGSAIGVGAVEIGTVDD